MIIIKKYILVLSLSGLYTNISATTITTQHALGALQALGAASCATVAAAALVPATYGLIALVTKPPTDPSVQGLHKGVQYLGVPCTLITISAAAAALYLGKKGHVNLSPLFQ